MYQLFYYPQNASWVPHVLLEEMGAKYSLVLVDRDAQAQKSPEYLKLNPTGRIPTLVHGKTVIHESAAIALYLCENNPASHLVPALNTPARAEFFQWLFYLTSSVQAELMLYFYPEKHAPQTADLSGISKIHETRVSEMFSLIDKALQGKDYLVNNELSVCDYFLFMLSHWASEFSHPPLAYENLGRCLRRFAARPAVQRVCETEGTNLQKYT